MTRTPVETSARTRPRVTPVGETVVAGVRISHADRVVYPDQGVTKGALARYYAAIADRILPELRARPAVLVRCPDGIGHACFYHKHAGPWAPPSLRRIRIREKTKTEDYLIVDDVVGLVGLVQMGVLEIHTWSASAPRLETPDRLVFDLDPGPGVQWPAVIVAARLVRASLEAEGLTSFVKTTGGKGLHVVAPIRADRGWDESADFARRIAEALVAETPRAFTATMAKAARKGKIFVDYFRNQRGATAVAAYSTRARSGAPVSTPVTWEELDAVPGPAYFTIANISRRLSGLRADPWAGYAALVQGLPASPGRRPPAAQASPLHHSSLTTPARVGRIDPARQGREEDSMARYSRGAQKSVKSAMRRRKRGTLKSGSGTRVTSRKQAIAIGLSEARKKGAKVPGRKR
jgi:bifunctional non-homologous end joining protein LigD